MAWIPGMLAFILFHHFFWESDIPSLFYQKVFIFLLLFTKFVFLNKAGIKLAQIWRSILTIYSQCTLERWSLLPLHVVQFFMACLSRLCFSPVWTWGLTRQILKISCRERPQKDTYLKFMIVLTQRFIKQTRHHV